MKYFAYIRVSTMRQGEHGSSLSEQRAAIESFAARSNVTIIDWFEERETASKVGRREFTRMLTALRRGKADGVIFHKIDRSTRNLRDWSAIQDLADAGIDIRFTQESINLASNEGKLTGDFMAVISAHYSRNLRDEVRKGIRGRLKQGFYPMPAPLGYLDQGAAKAKIPDPVAAPLVIAAFEMYATGRYSLRTLCSELADRGLRSHNGNRLNISSLADVLRNPFYVGVIRIKSTGEAFDGAHKPLITTTLFGRVAAVLDGKVPQRPKRHDFEYRRMLRCIHCGYHLIGETQKGHVYYRCHTRGCVTRSLRHEVVEAAVRDCIRSIAPTRSELEGLRAYVAEAKADAATYRDAELKAIALQLRQLETRLSRLTDAFVDGAIDRSTFEERKFTVMLDRKTLESRRGQIDANGASMAEMLTKFLELLEKAHSSHFLENSAEQREILRIATSNLSVDGKNVAVALQSPFLELAESRGVRSGGPQRDTPRTFLKKWITTLMPSVSRKAGAVKRRAKLPRGHNDKQPGELPRAA